MKTKKIFIVCLSAILSSGGFYNKIYAQSNINRLVNEVEKEGNIYENTVIKRNKTTKKTYKEIKNISFSGKKGLYAKKFQNAFEKDSEQAISIIKNGRNTGKSNMTLIFEDGKKKSIYTLNVNSLGSNPYVNVSIITYNYANRGKEDEDESSYIINGIPLEKWGRFQAYNNIDWKSFNDKMKKINENLKDKLKNYDFNSSDYYIINDSDTIQTWTKKNHDK